jgi:hypothetical protein
MFHANPHPPGMVADPDFQDHLALETNSVSGSPCIAQF